MPATERLIESIGLIFQESGAPRIAGRIFGLLLVYGEEMSLNQISETLGVSRASVSTNARILSRRGLLKRTSHSGDRQDYYELNGFPYTDMILEVVEQFRRFAATIGSGADAIRDQKPLAASRVDLLANFYAHSADILESRIEPLLDHPNPKDGK